MRDYAEVELGLHRWEVGTYEVDFRFYEPGSEAEVRPILAPVTLDLAQLNALGDDPERYGSLLRDQIFSEPLRSELRTARAVAAQNKIPLRLRLLISPTAQELHTIRWETLRDPEEADAPPLLTNENLLFSRYVQSAAWRPVRLRHAGALKALVVVANPKNLALLKTPHKLEPVNVEQEVKTIQDALGGFTVEQLASPGQATLADMMTKLREEFDVLYIVCHGAFVRGETRLALEDSDGDFDLVSGQELMTQLRELEHQPRLIVLASCQSATQTMSADGALLSALGPRLAEAGIPAVIGMQGGISMDSTSKFMSTFFADLQKHGQVDKAMAVGRAAIREQPDSWMPVLFMRLKTGRIWFDHDPLVRNRASFSAWNALLNNIHERRCTPIIGQGIYEPILGPFRNLARRWADTYRYPFRFDEQDDLPQIAQYLLVTNANDYFYPRDELKHYFKREVARRYGKQLTDDQINGPLDALINDAWRQVAAWDDPHRVLAALPCPLYVTATFATVLEEALKEKGKEPISAVCPWKDETADGAPPLPSKLDENNPVVYHLFGRLDSDSSIVLTEDDYFDYLIGTTRNNSLIPPSIRKSLTSTALLFLGFQLTDWNFRVLFRSLMRKEGQELRRKYAHVAVQMDPGQSGIQEPELVYRYLQAYFQEAQITIFPGTVSEFITTLQDKWRERFGNALVEKKAS